MRGDTKGIATLITALFFVGFVFGFAPVKIDDIPDEMLPAANEKIRLTGESSHLLGMDKEYFTEYNIWADYDIDRELPYSVITSGIYTQPFTFVNDGNIEDYTWAFVDLHPELVGISSDRLRIERTEFIQNRWYVTLRQVDGNTDYYDGTLELRISPDGRVFYLRNMLWPGEIAQRGEISLEDAVQAARAFLRMPRHDFDIRDYGMTVMVRPDRGGANDLTSFDHIYGRRIELFSHSLPANFRFIVSHNGDVIRFNNGLTSATGTISGTAYPRNMETPLEEFPWAHANIYVDGDFTRSDRDGNWEAGSGTGSHSFETIMKGQWVDLRVSGGTRSTFDGSFSGTSHDFTWTRSHARLDEMNVYYHVTTMHDYVKYNLGYSQMDYQMQATVGQEFDNAYFDGTNINMGAGSTTFNNLAYFADIIQHEYTHGVTAKIYRYAGGVHEGMGLAMNEAWSDYFPCAISDEPWLGEGGLYTDGTPFMRTISNSRRYPEDYVGECHYDGQILSGAMWNFREMLDDTWVADSLIHTARFGYATTFEDFLIELLIADDTDGDITNGTNHGWDIAEAFYAHGIGPGIASIEHTSLPMTDNIDDPYEVEAEINSFFDLEAAEATLRYNIHYSDWVETDMEMDGDIVTGEIPPAELGNAVWYCIMVDIGGGRTLQSPMGAPTAWHSFRVQVDDEPPVIEHTDVPMRQESSPHLFTARVTDNLGIETVRMEWSKNGVSKPNRTMYYDPVADYYYTYITEDIDHGDVLEYRFFARDNSSALLETYDPADGWYSKIVGKGFYDCFGPDEHHFTSYHIASGYENQWHLSPLDDRTGDGGYCYKFGAFGETDYVNAAEGALQLDPVPVEGEVTISFWHRMDAEGDHEGAWDGGVLEASFDYGGTWTRIGPTSGDGYNLIRNTDRSFYPSGGIRVWSGTHSWQRVEIPIGSHTGELSIRFRFGSDLYVTETGWFIDDVEIVSEYSAVSESPDILPDALTMTASPNPFNGATRIDLPTSSGRLDIFDTSGRLIESAVTEGTSYLWSPRNIATGVYTARYTDENARTVTKIVYMK